MILRYVNGLSLEQVAVSVNPYVSGESVRKSHDRFLKRN